MLSSDHGDFYRAIAGGKSASHQIEFMKKYGSSAPVLPEVSTVHCGTHVLCVGDVQCVGSVVCMYGICTVWIDVHMYVSVEARTSTYMCLGNYSMYTVCFNILRIQKVSVLPPRLL